VSEIECFVFDALADVPERVPETARRRKVHAAPEKVLKAVLHAGLLEQAGSDAHVHEQIQVAVSAGIAASDRPEHSNTRGSVSVRDSQDLIAASAQFFEACRPDLVGRRSGSSSVLTGGGQGSNDAGSRPVGREGIRWAPSDPGHGR
jgi:hypothetical protein